MDRNSLSVSFTKRRKGLFKKASDLCEKCDAQIAVIVISPKGNPFAFGHSSVDDVLRQFCPDGPQQDGSATADRHNKQRAELESLRARMKHADGEGIMERVEREWKVRNSLEELEFLKQKYLVLLDLLTTRLAN